MQITKENLLADKAQLIEKRTAIDGTLLYIEGLLVFLDKEEPEILVQDNLPPVV